MENPAINRGYLNKRLSEAGIRKDQILFPVKFFEEPVHRKTQLFTEDKKGNIKLRYIDLDGEQVYYDSKGKLKEFHRTRFSNPVNGSKYMQPKGSGMHMYWTTGIIEKFRSKEKMNTLFITEGEFKAFVGALHGLDIAGIGGIHNFQDKKENKLLPELEKLIETCSIKNVVLLFDADSLSVSYQTEKDLYERPNSFYSAVKRFKELTAPLNVDVYFSHINTEFAEIAKGLDDLINHPDTNVEDLKDELNLLSAGNIQVFCRKIFSSLMDHNTITMEIN